MGPDPELSSECADHSPMGFLAKQHLYRVHPPIGQDISSEKNARQSCHTTCHYMYTQLREVRNQFLFEKWQIVRLPVSARQ